MNDWYEIKSTTDIDKLLDQYGGFHDSCLTELYYRSGAYVDSNNAMICEPQASYELHMVFHSQWHKKPLELCFNGVRELHIAGFQDNYFCEILDCYLAFHTDLIKGKDDPLIVWADFDGFSPYQIRQENLLHEPAETYVIARNLKWRFITDRIDE